MARLFAAGYVRRTQVDGPGQFSVRGDIVDIYAPDMRQPARVEYWDDEIDLLSSLTCSPSAGTAAWRRSTFPCPGGAVRRHGRDGPGLRDAQKARGKRRTALEKAMEADLAQLDSGLMPEAMDKYYGLRYETPATLLDHLTAPFFVLDEGGRHPGRPEGHRVPPGRGADGPLEEGVLSQGLDVLYQTMDDLVLATQKQSSLLCENFLRGMNEFRLKDLINAEAFAAPNWGRRPCPPCGRTLTPSLPRGMPCPVCGHPQGRGGPDPGSGRQRLCRQHEPGRPACQGAGAGAARHLTAGCTFPFAHAAVLSSRRHGLDEGPRRDRQKRKKNKNALSSLSDIKPGDYVVHQSHGIGMYAGIQRLEVQGAIKDYLKIQYSGSDVLYVPVTQLDLLSRYTAPGDEEKVKLAKLGGAEWQRTRAKVKRATEEMAQELIELYARRRQAQGLRLPARRRLAARFRDPVRVRRDRRPAERHRRDQAGYGKALAHGPAALRRRGRGQDRRWPCAPPSSASWAASSAPSWPPTTLLAWQHYNTILSRMEAFPVKVGMLSRFRTAKQQKETLRGLQSGNVDIVVGTHRLLSKDVRFHDLGLVIIDEEQRFGVKHKEKLKENFIGVDMLTLSATPHPPHPEHGHERHPGSFHHRAASH